MAKREAIDDAVHRVLESGWYVLGKEVAAFEQEFAGAMGGGWSVGVGSGTDAIEIALRAIGIRAGDRVITVSHTAVATVAAIARLGATPVFVDIDPHDYTMAPDSLEILLTTETGKRSRALVVVHLYGQMADMDKIVPIARNSGLPIIEDCAQAHGASLNGRGVGCWGDLACFSFYPTKNLGALGDGGAVMGSESILHEAVRLLREYGWKERYVSDRIGLNSRLDELQAAILRARLPHLEADNGSRRAIADRYDAAFDTTSLERPTRHPNGHHVFHQYVVAAPGRDELQESLKMKGIATLIHYPRAVHQQPAYADPAFRPTPLPHTESVVNRILSLPMYPELSSRDVDKIIYSIRSLVR